MKKRTKLNHQKWEEIVKKKDQEKRRKEKKVSSRGKRFVQKKTFINFLFCGHKKRKRKKE